MANAQEINRIAKMSMIFLDLVVQEISKQKEMSSAVFFLNPMSVMTLPYLYDQRTLLMKHIK